MAKKKIKKNELVNNEFSYQGNFDSLNYSNNHSSVSRPEIPDVIKQLKTRNSPIRSPKQKSKSRSRLSKKSAEDKNAFPLKLARNRIKYPVL